MFKKKWKATCSLSSLLGEHGIEAVVLKGHSIAQYYPIPEHRYSCDLDLFVAGDDWERACEILEAKGILLEREVYKEVEFSFKGVHVELHRYITPVRGNNTLLRFEKYLRNILKAGPKMYFEGTRLVCPPLMFNVMLYIEHALGDLLHGKLTLKHVVDWVVLRKQEIDRVEIEARCKVFGFHRFLMLMDALANVVEGKWKWPHFHLLIGKLWRLSLSFHLLLSRRGIAGSQGVCLYSLILSEIDGTIVDLVTAQWNGFC